MSPAAATAAASAAAKHVPHGGLERAFECMRALDAAGWGGGLHARRRVDGVAEEAVARQLESDDAGEHRSAVQPDTHTKGALRAAVQRNH